MAALFWLLTTLTTLWVLVGIAAVARVRRRRADPRLSVPPVAVLKPLCGVDSRLQSNLRTFFEQDHPDFELVFGVQGADDPAAAMVRRLREQYPDVVCRLVVHDGGRGINPKVSNLRAMCEFVTRDIVVISDSNVAVEPTYLRELAGHLNDPDVGLVSSLFAGTSEQTLGATLENLHLNGEVAAGIALPTELLGHPVVVGKSMMFRRSVFERLGGFATIADVLAEDYVVGRMFHHAGYRIRLAATPIHNVNSTTNVRAFLRRHLRWGMIRLRLVPLPFLLEPLNRPLLLALLAPAFGVLGPAPLLWAIALTLLRDTIQWLLLRGPHGLLRALPLFPLRDLLVTVAWLATPFLRHITWRGNRVRVSAGTRLYAESRAEG